MSKLEQLPLVAGVTCFLVLLSEAPANAAALSFVAANGSDAAANTCATPATPCRTFAYALTQTSAGGEIKALTPGPYTAISINKSITLTGVPGALLLRGTAGAAISVAAGASGIVTISGFTLNGLGVATRGIHVVSAAQVTIKDCTIKNFVREGIFFQPTVAVKFAIDDTLFAANNVAGVYLTTSGAGSTKGALHRVTITGGGAGSFGVIMVDKSELRISESLISNHGDHGVLVQGDSSNKLWLSGNTITQNRVGFRADRDPGFVPTAESAGNNFIAGNTTDVATGAGTLPLNNLGPQ